jgi:shikimate kinase
MIIVLIGYMGSGKSCVGQELAKILSYNFIDLDNYIEHKEERSVSDIFKYKGEIYFRRKEGIYLNELLQVSKSTVLSLGGGTPCYGFNMKNILDNEKTTSIYLKTSIPELVRRLRKEKSKRPLINQIESEEGLMEFIGKHIFERTNFYSQSEHSISTDNLSIDEIIESIVLKLV